MPDNSIKHRCENGVGGRCMLGTLAVFLDKQGSQGHFSVLSGESRRECHY